MIYRTTIHLEWWNSDVSKILEDDKELRIDNQYYLKNRPVDFDPKRISSMLLKIRSLLDSVTEKQIAKIRNLIKNAD